MTTIHHVNVMVDDLAPATEFYRDVLGWRSRRRPSSPPAEGPRLT